MSLTRKRTSSELGSDENISKRIKVDGKELEFEYQYGGSVTELKNAYVFYIMKDRKTERKFFSNKKHGGKENCKLIAEEYRRRKSDELGKTRKIVKPDSIPIQIRQQISGFFDGDACILIKTKTKNGNESSWIAIEFAQSQNNGIPEILKFIQYYYGGLIYSCNPTTKKKNRTQHKLRLSGIFAFALLEHLIDHCVLKLPQVQLVKQYLDKKVELADALSTLKRLKTMSEYRKVNIDETRLTHAYIGGLWNAEGTVGIYHVKSKKTRVYRPSVAIIQKQSHALLHSINRVFNSKGTVTTTTAHHVIFGTIIHCANFLTAISDFVIGCKKDQLVIARTYCDWAQARTGHMTTSEKQKIYEWSVKLKKLKKL